MKLIQLFIVIFHFVNLLCNDTMNYCITQEDHGAAIVDDHNKKDSSYLSITFKNLKAVSYILLSSTKWKKMNSVTNCTRLNKPVYDQRWESFQNNHDDVKAFSALLNQSSVNKSAYYSVRMFNNTNPTSFMKGNKWYHLLLRGKTLYRCSGNEMDNCSQTLQTNLEPYNFFLSTTTNGTVWKLHNYTYLYTEQSGEEEKVYESKNNNCSAIVNGCVKIFLASCDKCNIHIKLTRLLNDTDIIDVQSFEGNGRWQTANINVNHSCLNVYITTNASNIVNKSNQFWAVGDKGYQFSDSCKNLRRYLNVTASDIEKHNLTCEDTFNHKIVFVPELMFKTKNENIYGKTPTDVKDPPKQPAFNPLYLLIIIPIVLVIVCGILLFIYIRRINLKSKKNLTDIEERELLQINKNVTSMPTGTDKWDPIKTSNFTEYVRNSFGDNRTDDSITKQFKCIPNGYQSSAEVGKQPLNLEKNRYKNILPYDENRVKLQETLGDEYESDYINASYVNGFDNLTEYILTQNPLEHTIADFCKMIWQEQVEHIVMISNNDEKYFCYWPNIGKTKRYSDIEITMMKVTQYEFYNHHELTIQRFGQTRNINHLHFRSWSPEVLTSYIFLDFINELLKVPHGSAPIVFHCLAGIGRSATILCCDIALRTFAMSSTISLFDIVCKLRECRANSVSNVKQYQLAHLIILESLTFKSNAIDINSDFEADFNKFNVGNVIKNVWSEQIEQTDWMYEAITPYEVCKEYPKRNRYIDNNLLPVKHSRVVLKFKKPDYIHAMYVDNYQQKKHFIVAQQPLPSTLEDFWLMILQNEVHTVINLNELDITNRGDVQFFPTLKNNQILVGDIIIQFASLQEHPNYEKLKLKIFTREDFEREITFLNVKNWQKIKSVPESSHVVLDIWKSTRTKVQNFPLLVCCDDGIVSSSLLVCFYYMVEKMLQQRKCDIVGAVRAVRRTHTNFINFNQFVFLHHCALAFYRHCYKKYSE